MSKWTSGLAVSLGLVCIVGVAWFAWLRGSGRAAAAGTMRGEALFPEELMSGGGAARVPAPAVDLPDDAPSVTGEEDLRRYVEWLRSLGHDELLRLSNAEFDFKDSELIRRLQALEGPWVVQALGSLAAGEQDPLLKAVLVEGLLGAVDLERSRAPELVPILDTLLGQLASSASDPYGVARTCANSSYHACKLGELDYAAFMGAHLQGSDNPGLLTTGFLFMGRFDGGHEVLAAALLEHAHDAGRLGALEGLRGAATSGRLPPEQVLALGTRALELEASGRNRMLLYEMVAATGGEQGLAWIEGRVRAGDPETIQNALTFLTLNAEPERASALLQELVLRTDLDATSRTAVHAALGALPGSEGRELLLTLAHDPELDDATRLSGLRGLWNQAPDERTTAELTTLFQGEAPAELRVEALRMMASTDAPATGLDLRAVGVLDQDPLVRAEAVQLAAMQPGEGTRAWLEERLLQDDSYDVKAAALGAMVYRAHYEGDGDAALGYLDMARKLTSDERTRAMIEEGERMVRSHDPRRLELELAEDAEFYATVARYTSGAAARSFERQALVLQRIVQSLRPSGR